MNKRVFIVIVSTLIVGFGHGLSAQYMQGLDASSDVVTTEVESIRQIAGSLRINQLTMVHGGDIVPENIQGELPLLLESKKVVSYDIIAYLRLVGEKAGALQKYMTELDTANTRISQQMSILEDRVAIAKNIMQTCQDTKDEADDQAVEALRIYNQTLRDDAVTDAIEAQKCIVTYSTQAKASNQIYKKYILLGDIGKKKYEILQKNQEKITQYIDILDGDTLSDLQTVQQQVQLLQE